MNLAASRFDPSMPTMWNGRYGRLMGDTAVFHLRYSNGRLWPLLLWDTREGLATCRAVDCDAARGLASAVIRAKRHFGGDGGGCFLIDEFGRVLVPASDGDGRRVFAGRLMGRLLFENPLFPREPIDFADHEGLATGDPWNRPYIGIPYHLHRRSSIYFYQQDQEGGRSIFPPRQDLHLIQAIRKVRPYGAVRIVVTPGGLVLTKAPLDGGALLEEHWQPVFVGVINTNLWFEEA